MLEKKQRINIFGCPIDNLTMEETIGLIDEIIKTGIPSQHVVINVDKLLKLRNNRYLREIILGCDIINADGLPIIWASRILKKPLKERAAGIDLMERLVGLAASKKYKLYFLGAKDTVLKQVVRKYKNIYPGIEIVGYNNGYWDLDEESNIVNAIYEARPDILFLAMSSPKKEFFLKKYLHKMNVPFVMGVGGAFDVVAGLTKRAPKWMQRTGLEWLFRLMLEPKRLWKRYLLGNCIFIFLVLNEFVRMHFLKKVK